MPDENKTPVVVRAGGDSRFLGLTKFGFLAAILAFVLTGAIAFALFVTYEIGQNRALAQRNGRAVVGLCALRADLQHRIADEQVAVQRTEAYLKAHPNGIPGISAALIKQGIDTQHATIRGQQSTVHVLGKAISCPAAAR